MILLGTGVIRQQAMVTVILEHLVMQIPAVVSMLTMMEQLPSSEANVCYSNPGEVVCWDLQPQKLFDVEANTCQLVQLWKVQPFEDHLESFTISSAFAVMTGSNFGRHRGSGSDVLVWTILPDPNGFLGFGSKGEGNSNLAERMQLEQERLCYDHTSHSDISSSEEDSWL